MIQPRNPHLPRLVPDLVNLLYERLVKGIDRDCQAVFNQQIRDFISYLYATLTYNRAYRLPIAYELIDVLKVYPEASLSPVCESTLLLLLTIQEVYGLERPHLLELLGMITFQPKASPYDEHWARQNHPIQVVDPNGNFYSAIPLMAPFFQFDEDSIYDVLPSADSYGWNDDLVNAIAWANNTGKIGEVIPGERYGSIPDWFPTTDKRGRPITEQAQVDRFLLLVDAAYGGFIKPHLETEPSRIANAIITLQEDWGTYEEEIDCEDDWERKT